MKRLILSLLALGCITLAQAQQKTTLAKCNGDTVAYLKKNFVEGKQRFIGQPVSLILDEWRSQLPVGKLIFASTGWQQDKSKAHLINGIVLYFITNEELGLRDMQKNHIPYSTSPWLPHTMIIYGIFIIFEIRKTKLSDLNYMTESKITSLLM